MDRLLEVLTGRAPLPTTRFVGHEGIVNDESWMRLLEALRNNKEAVGVRLRGCGINCTRASQLAEATASNTCLEVLELPDNNIGGHGAHALVDTLRLSNCTLKSIDLSGNPCCQSAAHAMQELDTLLKRNRVIKKLPKTPVGGSTLPMCNGLPSKSAHCTPANALPTPQLTQALIATSGLTPGGLSFELEQRLQHLEEAEATIRSELEHVRSFSSQSEVWQKKIDTAGQQIAAILSLVDSRNLTLEARLQTMEHWRASAEQAWAGQSKVLDDMAGQLLVQMKRVQALEGQLGRVDSFSSPAIHTAMSVRSSAALGSLGDAFSPAETLGAATLWQEMSALHKRLEKLEAASLDVVRDTAQPVGGLKYTGVQQQQQKGREAANKGAAMALQQDRGDVASKDATDAAKSRAQKLLQVSHGVQPAVSDPPGAPFSGEPGFCAQRTFSASVSELSSIDNVSPVLQTQDTGGDAAAGSAFTGVGLSPAPVGKRRGGSSGRSSWQAERRQPQPQSIRTTESLQERRGVGLPPLQVPNSPILWHVNSFAVSPGSCANTPTHERASIADFGVEEGQAPPTMPSNTAPSSHGSQCSEEEQVDTGDCSGFVMYAAAPHMRDGGSQTTSGSAAKRYGAPQSDPRDSVDISARDLQTTGRELRLTPTVAEEDGSDGGDALDGGSVPGSAATPGKVTAALGSPGTPRGSTFSVDAETVSLSVVMAGSAARPRAPAAATTETSPLAHAVSTKDPSDAEAEWVSGLPTGYKDKPPMAAATPEPGWVSLAASSSSGVAKQGPRQLGITDVSLGLTGAPKSPKARSGVEVQAVENSGTLGMSIRQWERSVVAQSASAAMTSVGSLTPTSKPCPAASPTLSVPTVRLGQQQQQLTSPPVGASAARRGAAPRASRSNAIVHRSIPEAKSAGSQHSPGRCEVHGTVSRPPNAPPHHNQQVATAAPTASAGSRPQDVASHDREPGDRDDMAGSSLTAAGREAALMQHPAEDVSGAANGGAACGVSKGNSHAYSTRSAACAAMGGSHPAHPAGTAGSSTGHGRASVQGHSTRTSASRGDSGAGASFTKPSGSGTAAINRNSKPGPAGLHRSNSSSNTATASVGTAVTTTRSASHSLASAASITAGAGPNDQPLRHGPAAHRPKRSEGGPPADLGVACGHAIAVAAPLPESEDSHGHEIHFRGQAVDLVARAVSQSDGGYCRTWHDTQTGRDISKEHSVCSMDAMDGATAAAMSHALGVTDVTAGVAMLHQPLHSSRSYRPVGAASRTLAPGTAGNVAGPHVKGGSLARTLTRNVTSVAGATKRWM